MIYIYINLQLQRASQSYDECGGGEQLEARQHYLSRPAAKYKRQRWKFFMIWANIQLLVK